MRPKCTPDHQKGFSSIIHKHSRLITKQQPPKIRVTHIIPPEIIRTDITNFRNLVQRLTGRTSSSAAKARADKSQSSPVSSSYQNTKYLMGTYNGSSNIRFDPNHTRLLLDDPYPKQCNLSGEYDHQVSTTDGFYQNGVWSNNSSQPEEVRLIKSEEEEMVVEAEWGMKEKTDTWFCSDRFLQEIDFS
uniref:VQ domain-containing protein n=1 Tax=Kalanchoe fedtschenkoi TaxID=63787 RepID=A0A7N0TQD8_KALFE